MRENTTHWIAGQETLTVVDNAAQPKGDTTHAGFAGCVTAGFYLMIWSALYRKVERPVGNGLAATKGDEVEKAFAGVGAQAADAGTSARVFGTFLTWMQERTASVFVFATANDVTALPPELLRKGRFDETFFIDLPTVEERREIWSVQINCKKRKPEAFELAALVSASNGYTGAEIEAAFGEAMFAAFADGREVKTADVLTSLAVTVPLSKLASEKIETLRAWAKGRARNASQVAEASNASDNRFEVL